jgi:hypothetical protein
MEIAWPSRIRSRAYGFDIERRVWRKLALVSSLRGDPTLKGRVKGRDPVASCSSRCFFHLADRGGALRLLNRAKTEVPPDWPWALALAPRLRHL